MSRGIRRLCVFCGSSAGSRPQYAQAAGELGRLLARRGITLVYGGGDVGLMGELARSALQEGGEVIGVIPGHLNERVRALPLSSLEVVPDMHARKRRMYELADAFVALPGGLGTVEEFFEVYTWCQLGLHGKPIGLLDVAGYYRPLLAFLDAMVAEGFLRPGHRASILVGVQAEALLVALASFRPVYVDKLKSEG